MTELSRENARLTVIIPTRNAGQRFSELMERLTAQSLCPQQIIVIDTESSDQTMAIAESKNCTIIPITLSDFDHGSTRNLAAAGATGEFIVFLTQDAIPANEHLLAELIKPMQADPNIAVCYGRQLPRHNAGALESFAREFNYPDQPALKRKQDMETLGLKTFFCSNSCAAYRRSIFEKLGGFKDQVMVNEDMLWAAKAIMAGYSTYYAAGAKVYHSHAYSLPQTFKRYFNIGRFFSDNQEVFANTGLAKYGTSMLKASIKRFYQQRKIRYIIPLLVESSIKAFACKTGLYFQQLCRHRKDMDQHP